MKKLLKMLLWTIGGLLLLIVIAGLFTPFWLGPAVCGVANKVVPDMTGCDFKMDGCSVNPYTGKLSVTGLKLSNPKGYDTPEAVSFDSLNVHLDMSSLTTKKIRIYEIALEKPFVSHVFDGEGSNNFERIAAHVEAQGDGSEKKDKEKDAEKDDKDAPKVLIDKLVINGTKLKYRSLPAVAIPLPTFTKIGYGSDGDAAKDAEKADGATFEEAGEVVWKAVKEKVPSIGDAVGAVGNAAAGAVGAAANVAGEAASKAGDAAKNIAGGATDAASKAVDATTDAAKKAVGATTDAVKDGAKAVGDGLKKLNPFGK